MSVVAWVERFGAELGLGALPLAERGLVEIRLEDGLDLGLELSPDRETLFLHSALGLVEGEGTVLGALLETLLLECHADSGVDGSALAIDPRLAEVVLWRALGEAELGGYEGLVRAVEAFVERAKGVRLRLAALRATVGGDPESRPEPADPLFLHTRFLRA